MALQELQSAEHSAASLVVINISPAMLVPIMVQEPALVGQSQLSALAPLVEPLLEELGLGWGQWLEGLSALGVTSLAVGQTQPM